MLASVLDGPSLLENGLELPALVHLHHDIASANELAIDVQLRYGGPLAVVGDCVDSGTI